MSLPSPIEVMEKVRELGFKQPGRQNPMDLDYKPICRLLATSKPHYMWDKATSRRCIIGEALHELGVSDFELAELDRAHRSAVMRLWPKQQEYVRADLADIQFNADKGLVWGRAVKLVVSD